MWALEIELKSQGLHHNFDFQWKNQKKNKKKKSDLLFPLSPKQKPPEGVSHGVGNAIFKDISMKGAGDSTQLLKCLLYKH